MRRWRLPLRSDKAIDDLARMWNPVIRGWIQLLRRFYRSALRPVFRHLNRPSGPLGHEEIQTLPPASTPSRALARGVGAAGAPAVCPLAPFGSAAGGWVMGAV